MRSGSKLFLFAKVILSATLLLQGCRSNYTSSTQPNVLHLQNDRLGNTVFIQLTLKESAPAVTTNLDFSASNKNSKSYQWLDSMVVDLRNDERKPVTASSQQTIRTAESIHLY